MPPGKAVATKVANAAAKAATKAAATATETKAPKLSPVSPTLKAFLGGVGETTRANTVKQLWVYIKSHGLQNPDDGKEVICDDTLKLVLGKDKVGFTEIPGLLAPHFPKKEDKKSR